MPKQRPGSPAWLAKTERTYERMVKALGRELAARDATLRFDPRMRLDTSQVEDLRPGQRIARDMERFFKFSKAVRETRGLPRGSYRIYEDGSWELVPKRRVARRSTRRRSP